jgi:hypothetical protein
MTQQLDKIQYDDLIGLPRDVLMEIAMANSVAEKRDCINYAREHSQLDFWGEMSPDVRQHMCRLVFQYLGVSLQVIYPIILASPILRDYFGKNAQMDIIVNAKNNSRVKYLTKQGIKLKINFK